MYMFAVSKHVQRARPWPSPRLLVTIPLLSRHMTLFMPTVHVHVQDDLVPVRHVHHMVTHETDARIVLNPNMAHADFLFSPSTQDRILAEFAEVRSEWVGV